MDSTDLMRTVRSLTDRDGPMWRMHCPMLDGLARAMPSLLRSYGQSVVDEPIALDASTLALAAFGLFDSWASEGSAISETSALSLMGDANLLDGTATTDSHDARLVAAVARNMRNLRTPLAVSEAARVRVELPSCGVIESAHCDAIWGDSIVEFKAVHRQFGVRDLRQLILYGALLALDTEQTFGSLVLANPRGAVYVKFSADDLASVISGVPFATLARDLADYLVGLGVSG